jgi:signal transduction histidine kinase
VSAELAGIRYGSTPHERGLLGEGSMAALLGVVLAGEFVVFARVWDSSQWQPLWLILLLGGFLLLGEIKAQKIGDVWVSSTTGTTVLAMVLLGAVPAAVMAGTASLVDSAVQRKRPWATLTNVTVASISALTGGLLIDSAAGPDAGGRFVVVVFLAGVAMTAVNVVLLGLARKLRLGAGFKRDFITSIMPLAPYHLLGVMLATGAAQMVVSGDVPAPLAVLPALVVSEFLLRYVARERARADEVVALTRERADLLEHALTAEVAEREWIAAHVHDDTLQTLAVVRQDIEEAVAGEPDALSIARINLDAAVAELRRTLVHVHPGSVAGQGLGSSLDAYASQALRRSGATWSIDVPAGAEEGHEALLYSIGRELLSNAGKHARASHVQLRVTRDASAIRLLVEDDGIGFAHGEAVAAGHFGLLTAGRRVAAAGGRMTLGSADGGGARIEVELPTS